MFDKDEVRDTIDSMCWDDCMYLIKEIVRKYAIRDIEREYIEGEQKFLTTDEYVQGVCEEIQMCVNTSVQNEELYKEIDFWRKENNL